MALTTLKFIRIHQTKLLETQTMQESVIRARYICTELVKKLHEKQKELQELNPKRKIKMHYPEEIHRYPSLSACVEHARKTVDFIRDVEQRLLIAIEQQAMVILESLAEDFNIGIDPEEMERDDDDDDDDDDSND